jgi:MoxR-like ATPase
MMNIIEATRSKDHPERGVSARGTIALYAASQTRAALNGRDYVIPEDVRELAVCVLAHRMGSTVSMAESSAWIESILARIPVPTENV